MKAKNKTIETIQNVYHYFIGTLRYSLYYSKYSFLIRKYIHEQIDFRVKSMDYKCYAEGQCKMCGCKTIALQMCDKSCDKPCYPKMFNSSDWEMYKKAGIYYDARNGITWLIDNMTNKFYKF